MNRTTHTAIVAAAFAVAMPAIGAFGQSQSNQEQESGQIVIQGQDRQGERTERAQTAGDRMNSQQDSQMRGEKKELSQQELQKWFEATAIANSYEIQAAELAQEKAQGSDIKQMARMIGQDHQTALDKLRTEADKAGVQISEQPELDEVHKAKLAALEKESGEKFDKCYLFDQDAGHRLAILEHSWAQAHVQNPEVQAYVEAVLPSIKQHAQRLQGDADQLAQVSQDRLGNAYDDARTAGERIRGAGQDAADDMDDALDDAADEMDD